MICELASSIQWSAGVCVCQMQNRTAVFLVNLKPAKMRGVLSEGMIMCASSPDKVEIIDPPRGVEIGDRVTVEGYPGMMTFHLLTRAPRLGC